jgi:hypothetical protein
LKVCAYHCPSGIVYDRIKDKTNASPLFFLRLALPHLMLVWRAAGNGTPPTPNEE